MVDAPTPIPAPKPDMIQYRGEIVVIPAVASAPNPEHQEVSAKELI